MKKCHTLYCHSLDAIDVALTSNVLVDVAFLRMKRLPAEQAFQHRASLESFKDTRILLHSLFDQALNDSVTFVHDGRWSHDDSYSNFDIFRHSSWSALCRFHRPCHDFLGQRHHSFSYLAPDISSLKSVGQLV